LLGGWDPNERDALVAALVALPDEFEVVPMRQLAWRMGQLISEHSGLSTLGSEAVAAAEALNAPLLVSSKDDSPGVRGACRMLRMRYTTLVRENNEAPQGIMVPGVHTGHSALATRLPEWFVPAGAQTGVRGAAR
jgi:hypothetical protein